MVAYSFKIQFRESILAGSKRQKIRADRKRHARPGEALQLYTGMRARSCPLIGRAVCDGAIPTTLDLVRGVVTTPSSRITRQTAGLSVDGFASMDGFVDWPSMLAFWRAKHPSTDMFVGVLIWWDSLSTDPCALL